MSLPNFNAQITLNTCSGLSDPNKFQLEFSIIDFENNFDGTNTAVGDCVFLDTSSVAAGTVSRYKILSILGSTATSVSAIVTFDDSGPSQDPSCAVGNLGFIARPTAKGFSFVSSPGTQQLPDKFAIYPFDYNFELLDTLLTSSGVTGATGSQGLQGLPGATGSQGFPGATGPEGATGAKGATGANFTVDASGPLSGLTNYAFQTVGYAYLATDTGNLYILNTTPGGWSSPIPFVGPAGATGVAGTSGPAGATGNPGATGPQGIPGPVGATGAGVSGPGTSFNNISRYQLVSTAGAEVWCVSSSSVATGLTWSQSGTSLTVNNPGHGRSAGDVVIIRNMGTDNLASTISSVTTDSFTLPVVGSATSGNMGAYSCAFTYAHVNGAGGILTAPANSDVQLLSLRIHLGAGNSARTGATYTITLPQSAANGAGANTLGTSDVFIPVVQVRQDGNTLSAVGNTISMDFDGSWNNFQLGALPTSATGIVILAQF